VATELIPKPLGNNNLVFTICNNLLQRKENYFHRTFQRYMGCNEIKWIN
jgi:hypothetical protein